MPNFKPAETDVWWASPNGQKLTNISEDKAARLAESNPKRIYFFAELGVINV